MSAPTPPVTGTIAAAGQSVTLVNQGYDTTCVVQVSGPYAGATVYVEGLPNTPGATVWSPLAAVRMDQLGPPDVSPVALPDGTTRPWVVSIAGYGQVRVRASALGSGPLAVALVSGSFFNSPPYLPGGAITQTPATGAVQRMAAGSIAPGQTLKTWSNKVALSATLTTTVTLYTVTAGKTFYLTDLYLSTDNSNLASDVQVTAGGVPIIRGTIKGDTAPLSLPGMESQPSAPGGSQVQIVFPAVAGPPNGFYFVGGFEQ